MSGSELPRQIGRYHLLSELGRGSMGRVYLARDPLIDRRIALKVLRPELLRGGDEGEVRRRFLHEARAAGGLSHGGIVTVYDADTDPETGCPYLAMEWVAGRSLRSLLLRQGRLEIARAVALAAQVARALDYAHRRGVVHRDVKPANLLVTGDDRVKVVDFGIAKLVSRSVTLPGRIVGSPYYMSPEQVAGLTVDGRADLFALGAVLYEVLAGRVAFRGESVAAVTHRIVSADPPPIESFRPEVPASLRALVGRALGKLPRDRFQTGAELAAALETVAAELVLAPAAGWPRPPRSARPGSGSETRSLFGATEVMTRSTAASRARASPAVAPRGLRPAVLAALVLLGILIGHAPARLAPPAEPPATELRSPDATPRLPPAAPEEGEREPSVAETLPEARIGGAVPEEHEIRQAGGDASQTVREDDIARDDAVAAIAATGAGKTGERAGPAEAIGAASLEIVHQSRSRSAHLSVWIDGEKALAVELRTKNPLTRLAGREHRWTIPVATGERRVTVLLTGASKRLKAWTEVSQVFAAGEQRQVRVERHPGSRELGLVWSS